MDTSKFLTDWGIPLFFAIWIFYALFRGLSVISMAQKRLEAEKAALDVIRTSPHLLVGKNKPAEATENTEAFVTLRVARRKGVWDADTLSYTTWIQPARYTAGVFVFIGLGGTVLGIALSLSSLGGLTGSGSEAATADQLQSVLRSVGAILSGMKTASICTVLGIGATLFQSWRNNNYLISASAVMEKAERVWRDTVQVEYAEAESLRHKVEREQQNTSLDTALRHLEEHLTTSISRANKEQSKVLSAAIYEMGETVNGATTRLDNSVALLAEHIGVSASQLSEASQTAQRVADTLEAVRGKLEGAAAALTDTMGAGYDQLGQIQNLIGESARMITVGHEKLSTVAASLETVVARVGDDRAATLDALTKDRPQTLEAFRRDREQIIETLAADRERLHLGLQATLKAMEDERTASLTALADSLKTSIHAASGEREAFAERFNESLTAAAAEREAMGRMTRAELLRAQEATARAEQDTTRLFDVIATNHQNGQEQNKALLVGVKATDKRLTELLVRFEKTLIEVAALSEQTLLHTAVTEVAEKLNATQKATLAGADALRTAALAVQNTATAQKEAENNLNAQTQGWSEAQKSLQSLQSLVMDTATATARVVAASEQTAEQMMHLVQQQAHDRSDLINLLWRIEAGLGHSADAVTTQINDAAVSGGVS